VRLLFIVTIFLGSALLFLAQPMAAKMILPRFGGSPAVWTTSVLFFQLLLLAGYWVTYWFYKYRNFGETLVVHICLLLFVVVLPNWLLPPEVGGDSPTQVALFLFGMVGTAFLVLSMGAPLVQRYYAAAFPSSSPYYLYAASNGGSLCALLAYPILVEPNLTLSEQVGIWRLGLYALPLLMVVLAVSIFRLPRYGEDPVGTTSSVSWRQRLSWLALAAVPSSLMLGLTSFATTNVAPVPLFWVIPLAVYLLTFVIAFCIVFEDAHVGIEAGLAAGARIIAVATTNPLDALGRAHLAVNSLEEVNWQRFSGLFD
jgi:hypothetical protein